VPRSACSQFGPQRRGGAVGGTRMGTPWDASRMQPPDRARRAKEQHRKECADARVELLRIALWCGACEFQGLSDTGVTPPDLSLAVSPNFSRRP
jgi:hypothetical protein